MFFVDFQSLAMHVFVNFTTLRRIFHVFISHRNVTIFVDFSNVCEKNQKIEHFFKNYIICVYEMYECIPRKMKRVWRSTKPVLPLYARRIEFDQQIRDFGEVFAACHAGTPPPPSPKLTRQNAEPWHVIDPLQAMEEGLTPIETTVEIAPLRNYVALLLRAAQYDPDDVYRPDREPDHESDEEMYA